MPYIKKEPLLEKAKSLQGSPFGAVSIVREIENTEGLDIVFCKECVYSYFNKEACTYSCKRRGYYSEIVEPTDFCSYGE